MMNVMSVCFLEVIECFTQSLIYTTSVDYIPPDIFVHIIVLSGCVCDIVGLVRMSENEM